MNRSVLSFLMLLFLFIFSIFGYRMYLQEGYATASSPSKEDIESANQHYAALLLFLKTHPDRSIPFIKDIQSKFFTDSCIVKPSISFSSLAQFPNGMIFV
jgi:hypothetical protein